MKYLTERHEIVEMMHNHPCIKIDMTKCITGLDDCFEGELVGVKVPSKTRGEITVYGTVYYFGDEKKFVITNYGSCIKASFGYEDIMEVKRRKCAPIVKENDEIILIQDFGKSCVLRVMKATRCNSMYSDSCTLVDVE